MGMICPPRVEICLTDLPKSGCHGTPGTPGDDRPGWWKLRYLNFIIWISVGIFVKIRDFLKNPIAPSTFYGNRWIYGGYVCIQCVNAFKGQLISKGLFGILNSSKNEQKKFDLTTVISFFDLFSFLSWKNLKTTIRHFEIN